MATFGDIYQQPLYSDRAQNNSMKTQQAVHQGSICPIAERKSIVEKEIHQYPDLAADDDGGAWRDEHEIYA